SFKRSDAKELRRGVPVKVRFRLMPTSFKFLKGQRIRISIGGADARHFCPIDLSYNGPPSTSPTAGFAKSGGGSMRSGRITRRVLRVHTGGIHASQISLPAP
ncbi:unnamed protein product, partial [Choristocarpus tenellus]